MLVPTWMGTNMDDGNQQKHSVTAFCYKTVKLSLEELINIKVTKEWSPIPLPFSLSLNLLPLKTPVTQATETRSTRIPQGVLTHNFGRIKRG